MFHCKNPSGLDDEHEQKYNRDQGPEQDPLVIRSEEVRKGNRGRGGLRNDRGGRHDPEGDW